MDSAQCYYSFLRDPLQSLASISCCLFVILLGASSVCRAQTIASGTIEVSGNTGFGSTRQTLSTFDTEGQLQSTGINVTTVDVGLECVYYLHKAFAIGGLVSHRRLSADAPSVDAPSEDAIIKVGSSRYGPLVKIRLPIDERASFVGVASFGGATLELVNQNTGLSKNVNVTGTGKYWLAGGGVSIGVASRASFDLSMRYEGSRFGGTSLGGQTDGAGLIVGIGFNIYFTP